MMQNRVSGKYSNFKKMLFALFASIVLYAHASAAPANLASLLSEYDSMKVQLEHNQFKRPLVLDSTEAPDQLKGSVYAVVDHPFGDVRAGLNNPDHWCDILFLHMNTKYCHADKDAARTILNVNIGKKTPEELEDSSRIVFNYKVAAIMPDYLKIVLNADEGPMGTSNYRIALEAGELTNTKTFIHLTYSYAVSMSGRLAMKAYLATAGSNKVGFTVTGRQDDGTPQYINGVRGIIERNTMRYYLAIDAFLTAANAAPNSQLEKRLQTWFAATERYPRQLHELELNEYLQMKRAENVRQLSMR
jgi:hypothetical protein